MILGLGLSLWPNRGPAGTGGGAGGGGYRFWRVLVDNAQAGAIFVVLAEICLYAPGSGVSLVTPSTPVIASSLNPYGPPEAVVNGDDADSGWNSQHSLVMGQWVTLDLGQARQVELVSINPTGNASYRPTRVVIQASNAQLTGYVTLAEATAPAWPPIYTTTPPITFGPLPPQT